MKFLFKIQEWPVLKWRVAYFGQYPLRAVDSHWTETIFVPQGSTLEQGI
jgi:hypothetical protein